MLLCWKKHIPSRGWLAWLLVVGLIFPAQAQVSDSTFSLDVQGVPLAEALRQVVEVTRIDLVYAPDQLGDRASACRIENAAIADLLQCVLRGTGFQAQRLTSGAYAIQRITTSRNKGTHTLSGFLIDATTGERLIGANLYELQRGVGTATNAYGFFSLTLPADSVLLHVSYVGYTSAVFPLLLDQDQQLELELQPTTLGIGEVEVVAARGERITEETQMSTVDVPVQQIQALPSILGEVDVLRTLQLLPGVQSGTEGSSGLYVRGGSPDQTLILLDGAPVYNASHFFGLFSVFNSDAVQHVELIKGGFPARYGGRLSSVLDIGLKEGSLRQRRIDVAIGLISSRFLIEGPLQTDRTSFMVSGRRTYFDAISRPFQPSDQKTGIFFYDLNAKINHILSPRDRLFASVYRGKDRFSVEEKFGTHTEDAFLQWGNITSTVRWNHVWSPRLFSNVTALFSRYQFDIGAEEGGPAADDFYELVYFSGIRDWGGTVDFDFRPSPNHYLRFGARGTYHTFRPGASHVRIDLNDDGTETVDLIPAEEINATEYAAYAEDDLRLSSRLKVNVGLHASGFFVEDTHYSSVQPRLSMRYLLPGDWAVKASYATMQQYIMLLTSSSAGLPTDLWLPATRRVPPQKSQMVALGVAHTLRDGLLDASVEGYYKSMNNLIEYENGASFLGLDQNWQDKVTIGKGDAYGVELLLQKKQGRTSGWVGYTLSWSNRHFDDLNGGRSFSFKYDRRHDLAVAVVHRLSPRLEVSGTWVYASGSAITLPTTSYYINPYVDGDFCLGCTITSFGQRNGYRIRAHHRLDLGVNFHKPTRRGEQVFSLGAYNAYNRKNPFFVALNDDYTLTEFTLFTIIPYLSYRRTL